MSENFSFVRRISQFGTLLLTRIWGRQVGSDSHGQRYFKSCCKDWAGRESRWVLYAGEPEASKIPPEWYAWLHHMADAPMSRAETQKYPWQKPHEPNKTGTIMAPLPPGHPYCRLAGQKREPATGDYSAWCPPNDGAGR